MGWFNIAQYDVVVVGGGPSGAVTSLLLAKDGMKVLLLEKGHEKRHKACGGVLPSVAPDTIEDIIDSEIPEEVFENPRELGLYYVPPSGPNSGGRVRNYTIHNINRTRFDFWLRELAEEAEVEIRYNTKATSVSINEKSTRVSIQGQKATIETPILVGADGVRSTVRKSLFSDTNVPIMVVGQEKWIAKGDFEDCFYGFFHDKYSVAYAYLIPKQDSILIGLGVEPNRKPSYAESLDSFRSMLIDEFSFAPEKIVRRESWAIPFGYFMPGKENAILVGDAAGLCNPLSGEGIRLAIESAESAANIIAHADQSKIIEDYQHEVKGLADMINDLNDFVRGLDNEKREQFVSEELSRGF